MVSKARLANLIDEVVSKWKFHNSYENCGDSHTYQCDLDKHTHWKTAFSPIEIGDRMVWTCRITTNGGELWQTADISIPKWLYDYYIKGKTHKISASQIEHKIHNKN